ncbi:MAG: 3-dehydroquinate dehydratase [Oscillospiraceae bacterium]|nr:3-dehydroquinate dehydratase [Oscillospiraceae bacterium]
MKTVLILAGPGETLPDTLRRRLAQEAWAAGAAVTCFQSVTEGELIDRLQAAMGQVCGVALCAGELAYTSVALRDAVAGAGLTVVEIDSAPRTGETRPSCLSAVCKGRIAGLGWQSLVLALRYLVADD